MKQQTYLFCWETGHFVKHEYCSCVLQTVMSFNLAPSLFVNNGAVPGCPIMIRSPVTNEPVYLWKDPNSSSGEFHN